MEMEPFALCSPCQSPSQDTPLHRASPSLGALSKPRNGGSQPPPEAVGTSPILTCVLLLLHLWKKDHR